jgi:undecaprenyl-diphosphatase
MSDDDMPPARPAMGLWRAVGRLARAARGELRSLILLALVAGGMLAFAGLAGEMLEGDYRTVDRAVLLALRTAGGPGRPIRPARVEKAALDITALGSVTVLTMIILGVIGYLVLAGKRREALVVLVATGGGALLVRLLKSGFERPRPDLVPHLVEVTSTSFPSGHAMGSAMVYLTLGALLARVQERRRLRLYFPAVAVILTVLVGTTRVYLGVHWPTDVVAGWLAGASWALLWWLTLDWIERGPQPLSDRPTR